MCCKGGKIYTKEEITILARLFAQNTKTDQVIFINGNTWRFRPYEKGFENYERVNYVPESALAEVSKKVLPKRRNDTSVELS